MISHVTNKVPSLQLRNLWNSVCGALLLFVCVCVCVRACVSDKMKGYREIRPTPHKALSPAGVKSQSNCALPSQQVIQLPRSLQPARQNFHSKTAS